METVMGRWHLMTFRHDVPNQHGYDTIYHETWARIEGDYQLTANLSGAGVYDLQTCRCVHTIKAESEWDLKEVMVAADKWLEGEKNDQT